MDHPSTMAILMTALLLASACATTRSALRSDRRSMENIDMTLCKAMEIVKRDGRTVDSRPLEKSATFTPSDWQVVARINLGALRRSHHIRWVWYDPAGEKYLDSGKFLVNPQNRSMKFNHAWHQMRIWGEEAAKRPGRWNVTVYIDKHPLVWRDFTIRKE